MIVTTQTTSLLRCCCKHADIGKVIARALVVTNQNNHLFSNFVDVKYREYPSRNNNIIASATTSDYWILIQEKKKNNIKKTQQQIRFFSTTPSPPNDNKEKEEEVSSSSSSSFLGTIITPQNQFYALVAGGTLGAYVISRGFLAFTNFFTHLTPTVIAKWGFYTGFGCASLVGGLALVTAENLYIRADPVYRYCYNWVSNDTAVKEVLGDGLEPGHLRSYRLDSGKFSMKGTWQPPRIQMIFDVSATGPPYRTGLVTCEAIKSGGFPPKLHTTLLKVDYETGNEGQEGGTTEGDQTLFLRGNEEDLKRISRRSGLSLDMLARSVHINRAAAGRQ